MRSVDELYETVENKSRLMYSRTDPVKASIFVGSTATALYAAANPDSAEWVNTAGHLATGSWGSSITDIAYDVLEPEEKTRKPAMIAAGLLTGNIAQGAQALEFVPGDYSIKSVAEAGLAASANALGTEKYGEDKSEQ